MRSRHCRAFAWGRHGQRDRKFGQTDGFYLVKTKERIFRVYFNTVKMPQCSVPGCTEMGAKYMHFTRWRSLFFFPTRAHSFFSTPLAVGEWSMTDIHLHETNPKQLTQWWAPIRRELTVPYHGGATWGDFSAGTSLVCKIQQLKPKAKPFMAKKDQHWLHSRLDSVVIPVLTGQDHSCISTVNNLQNLFCNFFDFPSEMFASRCNTYHELLTSDNLACDEYNYVCTSKHFSLVKTLAYLPMEKLSLAWYHQNSQQLFDPPVFSVVFP